MEKKKCYFPNDCSKNVLGCDCKPKTLKRLSAKPTIIERVFTAAFAVLLVVSLWAFIIFVVSNLI